jgi:DNA oxidative demethylase
MSESADDARERAGCHASDSSATVQQQLFPSGAPLPPGFSYQPSFITEAEEQALVEAIGRIDLSVVRMRGQVAKRRTAHFGWTYGYAGRRTEPGPPIPAFLLELRARAAAWADIGPEELGEALITEYTPGAGIGWHRDAPMFGDVIAGVSLLGACLMRFRPYVSPAASVRPARADRRPAHDIALHPRSGYLITGAA